MEKISLIPDFIQSENLSNAIISTRHIISISYKEMLNRYSIYFNLDNNQTIDWNYKEIGQAEFEYRLILQCLKNVNILNKTN